MSGSEKSVAATDKIDFNGGTVISNDGKEVAITEDMVRKAIKELDPHAFAETDDAKKPDSL
ncbi:MAG: hypothetical protein RLN96_04600 [Pseudomonadales bacterium]